MSYSWKVSAHKPMVQDMMGYGSINGILTSILYIGAEKRFKAKTKVSKDLPWVTGTLTSFLSLWEGEEVNKRSSLSIGLRNVFVNWTHWKQHLLSV